MKLSQFHAPKLLVVKLTDDQSLSVAYKPAFLTRAVAEDYKLATQAIEENTPITDILDRKLRYLSIVLDDVGIEAEDGTKIEPTFENLRDVVNLDMLTANKISDAISQDMFAPLGMVGASSDSGSPAKEEKILTD